MLTKPILIVQFITVQITKVQFTIIKKLLYLRYAKNYKGVSNFPLANKQ